MNPREEQEQQIWEFVYGLLSVDEAAELEQQITSDPDLARLYCEVQMKSELVSDAAKLDLPELKFEAPPEESRVAVVKPTRSAHRSGQMATWLNWTAGLAAALLLYLVGYTYVRPDSPIRVAAAKQQQEQLIRHQVQTTLIGPASLQAQRTNYLTVRAMAPESASSEVPVAYCFYGEDETLLGRHETKINNAGLLQIATPVFAEDANVRFELEALGDFVMPPVSAQLSVAPGPLTTHLMLDKPMYRPGELLRFRSLTLSRYNLRAAEELEVDFYVTDASDNPVSGMQCRKATIQAVANGELPLPTELADGSYRLVAWSPDRRFPDTRHAFVVQSFRTPTIRQELVFQQDSYGLGDQVSGSYYARKPDGQVLANAPVRIEAEVGGVPVLQDDAATNAEGKYSFRFQLPPETGEPSGTLRVTLSDNGRETISRRIPIERGDVSVTFYPEAGDLVAEVPMRVYFYAHDSQDKPAHIEGRIVDDLQQEIASIATQHDGRGVFTMSARRNRSYRWESRVQGTANQPVPLPPVNPRRTTTFTTGRSVFDRDQSIEIEVMSTENTRPLMLQATCRGAIAGQVLVSSSDYVKASGSHNTATSRLPLAEDADGVIRVTAYDLMSRPPEPVAERLVFREPNKRLVIEADGLSDQYPPSAQIDVPIQVADETGTTTSAILGVSVVNDALLALAEEKSPQLTTHFWLTSQINNAKELEDANFYLQKSAEAQQALDLLLGTQGWRKFDNAGPQMQTLLAQVTPPGSDLDPRQLGESWEFVSDQTVQPVVLANNQRPLERTVETKLSALRDQRLNRVQGMGRVVFWFALTLLVSLIGLALVRVTDGMHSWAPAFAIATMGLVVGGLWLSARIDDQDRLAFGPEPPIAETEQPKLVVAPPADERQAESTVQTMEAVADAPDVVSIESTPEDLDIAQLEEAPQTPTPLSMSDSVDAPGAEVELSYGLGGMGGGSATAESEIIPGKNASLADQSNDRGQPVPSSALPVAERPDPRHMAAGAAQQAMPEPLPEEKEETLEASDEPQTTPTPQATSPAAPEGMKLARGALRVRSLPQPESAPAMDALERRFGEPMPQAAASDALEIAEPQAEAVEDSARNLGMNAKAARQSLARSSRVVRRYEKQSATLGREVVGSNSESVVWQPMVDVGESGTARLQFTLPDLETSYRVLINGHGEGRIGTLDRSILVQAAKTDAAP